MPSFVRLNDAAAALGVSRQTLYRWSGEPANGIPIVKIGPRAAGIAAADLQAFIGRRTADSAPKAA
jgi:predicted DNA-binding transcriptional regulator AlpA